MGQLNNPVAFPAWLCTICKRRGINFLVRRKCTEGFYDDQLSEKTEDTVSRDVERSDIVLHVGNAVQLLGHLDKEILFAFYWRGLLVREIAEEFGIPIGTVKSRLYSARKHLLQKINGKVLL